MRKEREFGENIVNPFASENESSGSVSVLKRLFEHLVASRCWRVSSCEKKRRCFTCCCVVVVVVVVVGVDKSIVAWIIGCKKRESIKVYSMLVRKIVRVVFATMVDGFRRLSLKMV